MPLMFMGFVLLLLSIFMMLLVLVQRGKGGGLTGALGGMGGQSAFGSRAGDVFTRVTVVTAIIWIMLCMITIAWFNAPRKRTDAERVVSTPETWKLTEEERQLFTPGAGNPNVVPKTTIPPINPGMSSSKKADDKKSDDKKSDDKKNEPKVENKSDDKKDVPKQTEPKTDEKSESKSDTPKKADDKKESGEPKKSDEKKSGETDK